MSLKQAAGQGTEAQGSMNEDARQAVELERRRRRIALIAMLKLLDHGAKDIKGLAELTACMSGEELEQVAEERALAGRCGNPLCPNPFTWREPRKMFLAVAEDMQKQEGDNYCSKACQLLVRDFAKKLGDPMDRLKGDAFLPKAETHGAAGLGEGTERREGKSSPMPGGARGRRGVAAGVGKEVTMYATIQERSPSPRSEGELRPHEEDKDTIEPQGYSKGEKAPSSRAHTSDRGPVASTSRFKSKREPQDRRQQLLAKLEEERQEARRQQLEDQMMGVCGKQELSGEVEAAPDSTFPGPQAIDWKGSATREFATSPAEGASAAMCAELTLKDRDPPIESSRACSPSPAGHDPGKGVAPPCISPDPKTTSKSVGAPSPTWDPQEIWDHDRQAKEEEGVQRDPQPRPSGPEASGGRRSSDTGGPPSILKGSSRRSLSLSGKSDSPPSASSGLNGRCVRFSGTNQVAEYHSHAAPTNIIYLTSPLPGATTSSKGKGTFSEEVPSADRYPSACSYAGPDVSTSGPTASEGIVTAPLLDCPVLHFSMEDPNGVLETGGPGGDLGTQFGCLRVAELHEVVEEERLPDAAARELEDMLVRGDWQGEGQGQAASRRTCRPCGSTVGDEDGGDELVSGEVVVERASGQPGINEGGPQSPADASSVLSPSLQSALKIWLPVSLGGPGLIRKSGKPRVATSVSGGRSAQSSLHMDKEMARLKRNVVSHGLGARQDTLLPPDQKVVERKVATSWVCGENNKGGCEGHSQGTGRLPATGEVSLCPQVRGSSAALAEVQERSPEIDGVLDTHSGPQGCPNAVPAPAEASSCPAEVNDPGTSTVRLGAHVKLRGMAPGTPELQAQLGESRPPPSSISEGTSTSTYTHQRSVITGHHPSEKIPPQNLPSSHQGAENTSSPSGESHPVASHPRRFRPLNPPRRQTVLLEAPPGVAVRDILGKKLPGRASSSPQQEARGKEPLCKVEQCLGGTTTMDIGGDSVGAGCTGDDGARLAEEQNAAGYLAAPQAAVNKGTDWDHDLPPTMSSSSSAGAAGSGSRDSDALYLPATTPHPSASVEPPASQSATYLTWTSQLPPGAGPSQLAETLCEPTTRATSSGVVPHGSTRPNEKPEEEEEGHDGNIDEDHGDASEGEECGDDDSSLHDLSDYTDYSDLESDEGHNVPFFGPPPSGFQVEISTFGEMWTVLNSWVTARTRAMLEAGPGISQDKANSRMESAEGNPEVQSLLGKVLDTSLMAVVERLQVKLPLTAVSRWVLEVVKSFSVTTTLPAFNARHWRLICTLVLAALGRSRVPGLSPYVVVSPPSAGLNSIILDAGMSVHEFLALLDVMVS